MSLSVSSTSQQDALYLLRLQAEAKQAQSQQDKQNTASNAQPPTVDASGSAMMSSAMAAFMQMIGGTGSSDMTMAGGDPSGAGSTGAGGSVGGAGALGQSASDPRALSSDASGTPGTGTLADEAADLSSDRRSTTSEFSVPAVSSTADPSASVDARMRQIALDFLAS